MKHFNVPNILSALITAALCYVAVTLTTLKEDMAVVKHSLGGIYKLEVKLDAHIADYREFSEKPRFAHEDFDREIEPLKYRVRIIENDIIKIKSNMKIE